MRIEVQDKPEFMSFTFNAADDTYTIALDPISEDYVGGYITSFRAYLRDYQSVPELHRPKDREFSITIEIESAINHPAYFDPPLNDTFPLAITRTLIE